MSKRNVAVNLLDETIYVAKYFEVFDIKTRKLLRTYWTMLFEAALEL